MVRKVISVLAMSSACALAVFGVTSLGVTAASATTTSHCEFAQQRVNAIAAQQNAAEAQLTLLQAKLADATSKNKTGREHKIEHRITKVNARIARLNTRLQAVEQACQVQPAS
jgi:chaperonin cofactor prefoldin